MLALRGLLSPPRCPHVAVAAPAPRGTPGKPPGTGQCPWCEWVRRMCTPNASAALGTQMLCGTCEETHTSWGQPSAQMPAPSRTLAPERAFRWRFGDLLPYFTLTCDPPPPPHVPGHLSMWEDLRGVPTWPPLPQLRQGCSGASRRVLKWEPWALHEGVCYLCPAGDPGPCRQPW